MLQGALNPNVQDARGLVQKMHLNWEHASAHQLKCILVDGVNVSTAVPNVTPCEVGLTFDKAPTYRSLLSPRRRRLTRRFRLTSSFWMTPSRYAPWTFPPCMHSWFGAFRNIPLKFGHSAGHCGLPYLVSTVVSRWAVAANGGTMFGRTPVRRGARTSGLKKRGRIRGSWSVAMVRPLGLITASRRMVVHLAVQLWMELNSRLPKWLNRGGSSAYRMVFGSNPVDLLTRYTD